MKIGDQVRLLRGTEEGRIVNIKKNNIVEIEIEEGFIIPALKNEVVIIDKSEAESFKLDESIPKEALQQKKSEEISEGIYLGLKESDDSAYTTYLINQTDCILLYIIGQHDKRHINGKAYGICERYDAKKIGSITSSIFNEAKRLSIQIIHYQDQARVNKLPLITELFLKREHLQKKVYITSISEEVYLINIEESDQKEFDPIVLRDKMMESSAEMGQKKDSEKKLTEQTIDLHVDTLTSGLKPSEALEYQLNEFEKAFDNALVMNLQKLKIIHGVGSGILRNEIHKRLGRKTEVKFYEDADKERFGFGATIIYF